jgi:hypothetical protein
MNPFDNSQSRIIMKRLYKQMKAIFKNKKTLGRAFDDQSKNYVSLESIDEPQFEQPWISQKHRCCATR